MSDVLVDLKFPVVTGASMFLFEDGLKRLVQTSPKTLIAFAGSNSPRSVAIELYASMAFGTVDQHVSAYRRSMLQCLATMGQGRLGAPEALEAHRAHCELHEELLGANSNGVDAAWVPSVDSPREADRNRVHGRDSRCQDAVGLYYDYAPDGRPTLAKELDAVTKLLTDLQKYRSELIQRVGEEHLNKDNACERA